jgi:uncharacterized protein (TIGR00251 family)
MKPSPEPSKPIPVQACITAHPAGARLKVRVKPRASRTAIQDVVDEAIVVALAAPPVDGEANAALIRFLAEAVGVAKSGVVLANGAKSKTKILQFTGLDAMELGKRLNASIDRSQRK